MCSSIVFLSCQSLDCFATIYYGTNFAVNILMGATLYSVSKFLFTDVCIYVPCYNNMQLYVCNETVWVAHVENI